MEPEDLFAASVRALKRGKPLFFRFLSDTKVPPGFPKGCLVTGDKAGIRMFRYDPQEVIDWMVAKKLLVRREPARQLSRNP